MLDFQGQQVLVTGANRGIGLAVARAFLDAGAEMTITGLEVDVSDVAASLGEEFGCAVRAVRCDLRDPEDIAGLASALSQLDILVNNAGMEAPTPIDSEDNDLGARFRAVVDTNVVGTFEVTRALLPLMHSGARIINTASIWGKTGVAQYSAYCASKHAIIGMTRALAKELGPRGITVNAVCPGWVQTEAAMRSLAHMARETARSEAALLEELVAAQALEGLMQPADIAGTYLFLASRAGRNISGQAYTVDRGELLQ